MNQNLFQLYIQSTEYRHHLTWKIIAIYFIFPTFFHYTLLQSWLIYMYFVFFSFFFVFDLNWNKWDNKNVSPMQRLMSEALCKLSWCIYNGIIDESAEKQLQILYCWTTNEMPETNSTSKNTKNHLIVMTYFFTKNSTTPMCL